MRREEAVEVLDPLACLARHQLAVLPDGLVRELPTRQHLGGHELVGAHLLLRSPPADPRSRLLAAAHRQGGSRPRASAGPNPDPFVIVQHHLGLRDHRREVGVWSALGDRPSRPSHPRGEARLVCRRLQGRLRGQKGHCPQMLPQRADGDHLRIRLRMDHIDPSGLYQPAKPIRIAGVGGSAADHPFVGEREMQPHRRDINADDAVAAAAEPEGVDHVGAGRPSRAEQQHGRHQMLTPDSRASGRPPPPSPGLRRIVTAGRVDEWLRNGIVTAMRRGGASLARPSLRGLTRQWVQT